MKAVNGQHVTRHSVTPLDTDSGGCWQQHAADAEITCLLAARMFIVVFTTYKHGTYPEPYQSSHTLTYCSMGTLVCTAAARTTEQSCFKSQSLSRPGRGPPQSGTRRKVTSHPIRTVQLHCRGVKVKVPRNRPEGPEGK
jgi:hypothetical protein